MTHPTLKYNTWIILIDGQAENDCSGDPYTFCSRAGAERFHGENGPAEFIEYEATLKPKPARRMGRLVNK